MENLSSVIEVDRIAGMQDPVIRNLLITQSYHELSMMMSKRTGPCSNWCTIATWASKQAGQTIRNEDLDNALLRDFKATPEINTALRRIIDAAVEKGTALSKERLERHIWETLNPKAAMERASKSVARGNQKVYAEIAREFACFIESCLQDDAYNAERINAFCAALKPGDPPNGQRYLRQAFIRYYQSFFEPDPKAKAELIFLANLEIGFHEQTRLQPEIATALEAPLEDPKVLKSRLLDLFFPSNPWVRYIGPIFNAVLRRPTPLEDAISRFTEKAHKRLRLFLTDRMMALGFPNDLVLPLGDDLRLKFPAVLCGLCNDELVGLLKLIDPTPDSTSASGAMDWADLPDRLHFIADLFRCYHETLDLLTPPFDAEQEEAIRNGKMPKGRL